MAHALTTETLLRLKASPRLPLIAVLAVKFAGVVTEWHIRYRTRKDLTHLDAHLLRDIGLTREEAQREANRAFWRI
ncbi:DUF1127 domain-containing protein [Thalassococcus sp. S3]|uniref:DUF1127 domain-containing protein n=1 Tax=Thalassococcus sp. S3 TaxID=2017482 RepID=UPI00102420F3|nr:DUF1127 domain-containing protein [Thalassococcus sp. S3]QBF31710.1 hypothetical protein CFI11_10830 [Thalassococcus sp. S3]